jgi:predicted P-loop ATPase
LKKWLVALVACAVEPDVVNQTVLILQGGQGLGKSTWLNNLVPKQLTNYLFSGVINPNDKDTMVQLSECLLIQLDELETLSRHSEGALKEIITKKDIRVRRSYARFASNLVRRASLCGSVNTSDVLHDPTGSRRFLIHQVTAINYQHGIEIDNVYAQAYHAYKSGFRYWFDDKEIRIVNDKNQEFQVKTVEEEQLAARYEPTIHGNSGGITRTVTELLMELNDGRLPANASQAKIRLGQALRKQGFASYKSRGLTYWRLQTRHNRPREEMFGKPNLGIN